jgi:D-arginine dehydrogenase
MRAVVVGCGFAGLSTAVHLAKKGVSVVVLERDPAPALHASGKNAGMIRQAVSDPHLARLAMEGRRALAFCHKEGWGPVGFKPNGSLLLAKDAAGLQELHLIEKNLRGLSIPLENWNRLQIESAVHVLKGADFTTALFCPGDALVDIGALLECFLKEAKRFKIEIVYGAAIEAVGNAAGSWTVRAAGRDRVADVVVNAAGAWAGEIGRLAGALAVPLKAYRRHLYQAAVESPGAPGWPFVWDLSNELYFRPMTGQTALFSPCDKTLFELSPGKQDAETVDPAMEGVMKKKLADHAPALAGIRLEGARAALRTMAPDGRFVLGEDPSRKGFFWAAGLGGHGVTTAFSAGRLAADLILGDNKEVTLANALSPARFLTEESRAS